MRASHRSDGSASLTRTICRSMLVLLAAVAACTPAPTNTAHRTPSPSAVPAGPAELRLGLIGDVPDQNVWALFGGVDYAYNAYAVRSTYWPRLYTLAPPGDRLEALAAASSPGGVNPEGAFYVASVPIRTDLRWSDGSAFSAGDVAFTVNAALEFELGFDWMAHYDPVILDHAEAISAETVKFYFRRPPGVGAWQHGALQGPVVREAFWATKVAAAAEKLPPEELRANIETLRARITVLQEEANALYAASLTAQGEQVRQLQAELKRKQGSLDEAINDLAAAESEIKIGMDAARAELFQEDDGGEPLLGPWLPEEATADGVPSGSRVSVVNSDYSPPTASYQRIIFHTYPTRDAAEAAINEGEINLILDPSPASQEPMAGTMRSPTRSMRFLLFNVDSAVLSDAALRGGLTCMLDQQALAASLAGQVAARTSFVPPEQADWYDAGAILPCAGLAPDARLAEAVRRLKSAGYTWDREPSIASIGQGLRGPDGSVLPNLTLLAPATDDARLAAASYVEQQARLLGLQVNVQAVTPDAIDYAVLSSGGFDLAIFGWRLSPFPSYLCEWYGAGGTLHYEITNLTSLCGELAVTSDMQAARGILLSIQQTLADEVPLVPLYSPVIQEQLNGVSYPFEAILDGLAGAYGAPGYAAPAVP